MYKREKVRVNLCRKIWFGLVWGTKFNPQNPNILSPIPSLPYTYTYTYIHTLYTHTSFRIKERLVRAGA